MGFFKQSFKKNTHNWLFKNLAGFGRNINRLYENRNHNLYSNGELTVIKKLATLNPATIIDGGANIGKYSLVLNEHIPQAKIYAFEPVNATFEQLTNNLQEKKNIIPVNKGLFSENGKRSIHLFDSNTHSSLYKVYEKEEAHRVTEINLVKGDDWMQQNNIRFIDFLKLDLEGAELDALKGFEKSLKNQHIQAIQFEYGTINIITKYLLRDFYLYLNDHGYRVGKIYPKKVDFREYKYKHEDFIGPNFMAVPATNQKLIKLLS